LTLPPSLRRGCNFYAIYRCNDPECPHHGSPSPVTIRCEWFWAWGPAPTRDPGLSIEPALEVPVPDQLRAGGRLPIARMLPPRR